MLTKNDIKFIKSLSDKQARTESGMFVVEGRKMVAEAINSGWAVSRILTKSGSEGRLELTFPQGYMPEDISEKDMERISQLKSPADILALVGIPERKFDINKIETGLVLAADGIQDPGNMGTIIRIADWFGIADVVCSADSADCYNPKVVQATMGALFRVGVHYCELPGLLKHARKASAGIYGTFLDGENIYDADLARYGIIVMGSEGRGVTPACEKYVDRRLFIPPYPAGRQGSESLNVAAATAVICSEFRRRK